MTPLTVARGADSHPGITQDWIVYLAADEPSRKPAGAAVLGPLWCSMHGWLHDAGDLATALGGRRLLDEPDEALILRAFERWRIDAFPRLRGVFALAIGDTSTGEVVIARDALGSHPLFFGRTSTEWVFADSTRSVLAMPGVSKALNRAAMADHLCHRWPVGDETFFEAVRRLPGGALARLKPGSCRIARYWDPAAGFSWSGRDSLDQFPDVFDRAVNRCLRRGATGIFLSGGLDSISVAASAADQARANGWPRPLALSLAMGAPECDERSIQQAVAAGLNLPQQLIEFEDAAGSDGLVAEATSLGRRLSSPLLNFWAPAYLHLAESAASAGIRTVLSGHGGDEWLSVSPYLSADLIAGLDLREWWRFFGAFQRSYRHPLLKHVRLAAWTFGARPLASRTLSRLLEDRWRFRREERVVRNDPPWVAPDSKLREAQRQRAGGSLEDVDPPGGFYLRELRSTLDHPLTSWELEEQYELGRINDQWFAHPYWDCDLVDMLYRTPPRLLSDGGRAKGLIRGGLARRFPAIGLDTQRKVPGTGFYRTLVARTLPRAAASVGPCKALADLGIITGEAARGYSTAGFGTSTNRWDVINLETWVRAHS